MCQNGRVSRWDKDGSVQAPTLYRTKREVALRHIREAIISGAIAPGARSILADLSQRFGLSMTPIREALPVLQAEGCTTQSPHKRAIVAPMDREETLER